MTRKTNKHIAALNKIMGRIERTYPDLTPEQVRTLRLSLVFCDKLDTPIDFERLAQADDFNLAHDVFGVDRHMDRTTRKLTRCFVPRYAVKHFVAAE